MASASENYPRQIRQEWQDCWPRALALWSPYVKLHDPSWCLTEEQEISARLHASFAMIRLQDHTVVISIKEVIERHLENFALEILAHEIGHHVYAPADISDQARMIARMRKGLPGKEHLAPFIANLYTDLLINDRLVRFHKLQFAEILQRLSGPADPLWTLYMRIAEILWSVKKGVLAKGKMDDKLEGDAQLGARLIRNYAKDWLEGSGRFAALCLSYVLPDEAAVAQQNQKAWSDMAGAASGGFPEGLSEMDASEQNGSLHPAFEESGDEPADGNEASETVPAESSQQPGGGQYRQPFEYGQILKALGLDLNDHEIAVKYYRERALPYLIPFPAIEKPQSVEPLREGSEIWDTGSSIENIDWVQSAIKSPYLIPGYTIIEPVYGTSEGSLPVKTPVDLDLYVDCSGSMPNPQIDISYLTLAGAIISLSALRAGSKVQATLWSGTNQFESTDGFVRDENQILKILTGYLGGGTAFPIHKLRDTYADRPPHVANVHILVISDDGVTTILENDEKGNKGADISQKALEKAGAGGTMVLNLYQDWHKHKQLVQLSKQGWNIHRITDWTELVAFAKQFSRQQYGK